MHILISAVSSAQQPSGICRHAANLAAGLSCEAAVHRVTLVLGWWQVGYFQSAFGLGNSNLGIHAVDIENNGFARNWWYYRTLPKLAEQQAADLVHLTFPAPVRRHRFPCPVVCSLHDLYPYDSPHNFGYARVLFNRVFLQQSLHASDAIICSSDFTRERLRQHAPAIARRKATRIYQSAALEPGQARTPAKARLLGSPFLLAVAQHRRNKNLHLLLAAFAELRNSARAETRLNLVIVGAEGPETRNLHSLVQGLSLQKYVHFESALSDAELRWLYQQCELMIVSSSVEGFCLPVIEALLCGSRVLCSDIPVLREIGGSHCCYFDLYSHKPVEALQQAISSALLMPAAAPSVSNRFSPREIARQHIVLYSRLTGGDCPSNSYRAIQADTVQYDRYAG